MGRFERLVGSEAVAKGILPAFNVSIIALTSAIFVIYSTNTIYSAFF